MYLADNPSVAVKIHFHQPTVEQVQAQKTLKEAKAATEAVGEAQQLAEEVAMATEIVPEASVGAGESVIAAIPTAKESQLDETIVEVKITMAEAGAERPIRLSTAA